jgi:predicted TIM-barrel fold metal-dependent hydrolase|tara:strand:+ start:123 stop:1007 length:885 start_codon:yes stop_codon:yes gene_type:complete
MTELQFVDTHVHFWDRPHEKLTWAWLADDFIHPLLGDTKPLKELKCYTVNEFIEDTEGSNVTKAIHIQAAIGSENPVDETIWLQEMVDKTGYPLAIVGDARLQQEGVESVIAEHAEHPNFRGMRDFAEGDYLVDENFHRGYSHLEKYDLVYDLDVIWEDMHKAADLAKKFPNIILIVDHAGFPQERTAEYFWNWRDGMKKFAGIENAFIKISGLGMGDQMAERNWTLETIRPWVESCIEIFGIDNSFFGTNWPVDKMYSTYGEVIDAYKNLISGYSSDEQIKLFSENAERVYRI